MFKVHFLVATIVLAMASCAQPTSTYDLLHANFLTAKPTVTVKTPGLITDGASFTATVTLTFNNNAFQLYTRGISWQATSGGTLTVISEGKWVNGSREYILSYTKNLIFPATANEAFTVRLTDREEVLGLSPTILVQGKNSLVSFTVFAPVDAVMSTNFSVTITARLADNSVFNDYNGGVNVTSTESSGTLTVTNPVTGFVNGQRTVNISYSALAADLKIRATDAADSGITGLSGAIRVAYSNSVTLSTGFGGWGVASDKTFLQWNKLSSASAYRLSRRLPDLSYQVLGTYGASVTYAYDSGLPAATNYYYRLEILDSASNVLSTTTAWATTMNSTECTTIIAGGTINTVTDWTIAASPYCITANLTIDAGGQLTIERGSSIRLTENVGITVQNGAVIIMADSGTGQTLITTRSTASPPAAHNGITFAASATPTTFSVGTENYGSGSVLRHFNYMRSKKPVTSAVDLLIADALLAHNTSPASGAQASAVEVSGAATVVVQGCVFQQNSGDKGAVVLTTSTRASVRNSLFENNTANANSGGSAYFHTPAAFATGNLFIANFASGDGGAVKIHQTVVNSATITSNQFIGNRADANGGGLDVLAQTFAVGDNTFKGNSARSGGALFVYLFIMPGGPSSSATIDRNMVSGNYATINGGGLKLRASGQGGGGHNASVYTRDNIIENNSALNAGGGIEIDQASAVANGRLGRHIVEFNNIKSNTALNGGGVVIAYNFECNVGTSPNVGHFSYNIFEQNAASEAGGVIYINPACSTSPTTIVSTTLGNHNNFIANSASLISESANIFHAGFSLTDGFTVTLDKNYLEGATDTTCAGRSAMKIRDHCALLPVKPGFIVTNPVTSLYPTCAASPADIDCVGKR